MQLKSMRLGRVAGWLSMGVLALSQISCGGGGSGGGTTQAVAGPDTKIISGPDAAAQLSQVSVSTTDNSTSLQFNAGSAYGDALRAGDVVQVLPGIDTRFPLGFAGKVNAVSTQADGSKSVSTRPARMGEVFSAVQSTQAQVDLNAGNLVAIIMPSAVKATMGAGERVPSNVILSPGQRARMSKLSASPLATTDVGTLVPIKFSIPISEAGADPSKTFPVGGKSAVSIDVAITADKLKLSHDYQSEGGVPTKINGVVSGDWVFSVAMTGAADFSLGYASAVWKEVEDEHFKLLGFSAKATGLDPADKIGKIPLAAFVWVPEVPATVTPYLFGKTQTAVRSAKMAGVVVWVYLNAKGQITLGDGDGGEATVDFFKTGKTQISLGANYERGQPIELISSVTKSPDAAYAYQAPHIQGKLSAGAKVGASLDMDFFIGGIRFANTSGFVGGQIEGGVQGEGGLTATSWSSGLEPSGLFCYGWSGGYGGIFSADINIDVELESTWHKSSVGGGFNYSKQLPETADMKGEGWHALWYTALGGTPVCKNSFDVPMTAKLERQNLFNAALYDVRIDFSEALNDLVLMEQKGHWKLKIGGDANEVIDLDPAAGGTLTKPLPAGTYSFIVEVLHPELKSQDGVPAHIKDSKLVNILVPGLTVHAQPFLVGIGEAVMLWVANAWDSVARVVWNFGAGVAEQTAQVINGVSARIVQAFDSAGVKTVTAVFQDLFGAVLGSSAVNVTVNNLAPVQTASIAAVTDDVLPQTGVLAPASATDDTTPTLTGTVSAALALGQKLNVYDGSLLFDAVALVNGTSWSFTPAAPLSNGPHSFTVELAGVDGTPGPRSAPYAITIDASGVSAVVPGEIIRTLTGSFDIAGHGLPTSGISVTVPGDPKASCQSPNNMTAAGFGVTCTFYQLGAQTLEVRSASKLIGTVQVTVKTNVTGVTWVSPSTTSSGTVRFGEAVSFQVAGVNLLADPVMGFAVQLCGVSNTEVGTPTDTARSFTCWFNNAAGAVAGQMPGVVKDAPGGHVLFSGWAVPVEVLPVSAGGLPHTGIASSHCYAAGSDTLVDCNSAAALALNPAQDGMRRSINPMTYSLLAKADGSAYDRSECVRDQVTGLTWEGKNDGARGSFLRFTNVGDGAATEVSRYVDEVNASRLCGYSDWRLPTPDELLGIVDHDLSYVAVVNGTVNASWFNPHSGSLYWSSRLFPGLGEVGDWYLDFFRGQAVPYMGRATARAAVRLVRAPAASTAPRFTVNADGTEFSDRRTQLVWKRCSEGMNWDGTQCAGTATLLTHEQALTHAKDAGTWRLPNAKELFSLTDLSRARPSIDPSLFPGAPSYVSSFWSSTPIPQQSSYAWSIEINGYGAMREAARSTRLPVWLVRAAP